MRLKLINTTIVIMSGLILASAPVYADSMRCGTRLVTPGDSKAEVLQRCGEPVFKETTKLLKETGQSTITLGSALGSERISTSQSEEIVPIEEWTYKPGDGQFMRILTFRAGTLESIRLGDK